MELALLWVAAITGVIGAIGSTALGVQAAASALRARRKEAAKRLRLFVLRRRGSVMDVRLTYKPAHDSEAVFAEVRTGRRRSRIALWRGSFHPETPPVEFIKTADANLLLPLHDQVDGFCEHFTVYPCAVSLEVLIWPEHSRGRRRPLARRKIWITSTS